MNNCPEIKICGIRTPASARQAVLAGADYIGVVFHQLSRRAVDISNARDIAAEAHAHGAVPVAVFVEQNAEQMLDICVATAITTIQLHGALARQTHLALGPKYRRFYVRPVSTQGALMPDNEQGLHHCDPTRDYVLFDHEQAGQGRCFDWQAFQRQDRGVFPMIFAGGLRAGNVGKVIQQFRPAVVDVSSGVEDNSGEKNNELMTQFVQTVRGMI